MFQFVCKNIPLWRPAFILSRNKDSAFLQLPHFSTTSNVIPQLDRSEEDNRHFPINYLTCRLSRRIAESESESKRLNIETRQRPGSAISFLSNQHFKSPECRIFNSLDSGYSRFHRSSSDRSFLSKVEFFMSVGISANDITLMGDDVLGRNLEKQIIPLYKYISSLVQSDERTLVCFKNLCMIKLYDLENVIIPNIGYLRKAGISHKNVVRCMWRYPYAIAIKHDQFKKGVNKVKSLCIHPKSGLFPLAVIAVSWNTESEWRKKVEIYKNFGLSYAELKRVFRKYPSCMMIHAVKILKVMDFLVNKMGFELSFVMKRPVFYLSLEETIVPRCIVYQALLAKGLAPKLFTLRPLFSHEEHFLSTFVEPFEAQIQGLRTMYSNKELHVQFVDEYKEIGADNMDVKLRQNKVAEEIVAD